MTRLVLSVLACAVTAFSSMVQAQGSPYIAPPPPPMMYAAPAPPPTSMLIGNQYYDMDLDGFREYLDSIRESDPALWARLDPKLQGLESSSSAGTGVLVGGVVVGAAVLVYGLTAALRTEDCGSPGGTDWNECTDRNQSAAKRGLYVLPAGIAIMGAGYLISAILKPGRRDFLDLVNQHNRVNPESPIRLQVGFAPLQRGGVAGLQLSFF